MKKIINKKTGIFLILILLILSSCGNKKEFKNKEQTNLIDDSYINNMKDIMFLKTVYFDFDSYVLTDETKSNLKLLVKYLKEKQNQNKTITLIGYCDKKGSDEYNINLSKNRAEAVKNYLVKNKINNNRINIVSAGKDKYKNERKVIININNN